MTTKQGVEAMNLIGICGKANAGKDTAADVLVERFGFVKVALADPLKRICRDVFRFTDEQLWGPSEKRNETDPRYPRPYAIPHPDPALLTPRYALQTLGTEWGRACYENVWVDYAIRIAKLITEQKNPWACGLVKMWYGYSREKGIEIHWDTPPKGIVISDVRFPNEVEAIKAAGGQVWRIIRPGSELPGKAGAHVSETALDNFVSGDCISNDSTLESLRAKILAAAIHSLMLEPRE
jgi:hypothetical protein